MKAIAALILSVLIAGCEAPPAPTPQPDLANAPNGSSGGGSPIAAALRNLTNTSNGLEIRRLIINEQPGRTVQAILIHADGNALDAAATDRLKRNGLRFVRLPAERVEQLIMEMGGASYDANEWHGQVFDWRSLVDRPIDDSGRAIAIDGLVRRYDRGEFRLMFRSWIVQMEDGPVAYLEMLPRRRLSQANNYRRLLAEQTASGSTDLSFESMAINLPLESGFAYVLTSESPEFDWPVPGEDGTIDAAASSPPRRGSRDLSADVFGAGPETEAPPTLGELLLSVHRDPPARGMLILIPRISPDLMLPELADGALR